MGTEFSASSNSFEWFYQARVVLYAGGYSSNELIFNAKGSNKHNWFGFNRLKNEPWSDIQTESLNLLLSLQFPNMATALLSTACTMDVLRMMNWWCRKNRSEPQQIGTVFHRNKWVTYQRVYVILLELGMRRYSAANVRFLFCYAYSKV